MLFPHCKNGRSNGWSHLETSIQPYDKLYTKEVVQDKYVNLI